MTNEHEREAVSPIFVASVALTIVRMFNGKIIELFLYPGVEKGFRIVLDSNRGDLISNIETGKNERMPSFDKGAIEMPTKEGFKTFSSFADYLAQLKPSEDVFGFAERFGDLAGMMESEFNRCGIPIPAAEDMEKVFLTGGDNYESVRNALRKAFAEARYNDKLEEIMFQIFSGMHEAFLEKHVLNEEILKINIAALMAVPLMRDFEFLDYANVAELMNFVLPVIMLACMDDSGKIDFDFSAFLNYKRRKARERIGDWKKPEVFLTEKPEYNRSAYCTAVHLMEKYGGLSAYDILRIAGGLDLVGDEEENE